MSLGADHAQLLDAAVYVLNAMEPEEESSYEQHLTGCARCREEVAALAQVVGALAVSAPQYAAPPTLRDSVLRSVAADHHSRPLARHRGPRPMLATALGAVVALAALVAVVLSMGGARRLQATVPSPPGRAELQLTGDRATLIVREFPEPTPGHVYEVWLKRAGGAPAPTPTLFSVTARGAADVGLPESLDGVREILVTEEPAGGSVVSTHRPLIIAPVS